MIITDYICIKQKSVSVMLNSETAILFETVPKFLLYNIFLTNLFLNLDMFQILSSYEIIFKLCYTYVDDMLKFSRKLKAGNMWSWNFECYKSKF